MSEPDTPQPSTPAEAIPQQAVALVPTRPKGVDDAAAVQLEQQADQLAEQVTTNPGDRKLSRRLGALGVNLVYNFLTSRAAETWPFIQGLMFILVVLLWPDGLMGILDRLRLRGIEFKLRFKF